MLRIVHTSAPGLQTSNLDDEALSWVVRLTSGEAGEVEHDEFRVWRDQSAEHAAALARARVLYAQVGSALPRSRGRRAGAGRRWTDALAVAASLALCVSLGDAYLSNWRYDQATEAGERRTVRLPDGSRMIMAGDSAANIRFEGGVRTIELARGRAAFSVVHDKARPFVVHADGHKVRDIGTVFDVAHGATGLDVTVVQGSVEVATDERRLLLTQDQAVTMAERRVGTVRPVDATTSTAWMRGRLIVEDQPLSTILSTLAPHYGGRVLLLNNEVGRKRLSAVIDLDHIDHWLTGLAQTKAARLTRLGGLTILT